MTETAPRDVDVDLADPVTFVEHDPRTLWQRWRAAGPIHWHEPRGGQPGFWVLTRHADIEAVYRDARRFRSGRGTVLDVLLRADDSAGGRMLAVSDGEHHRQLRSVMSRAFSPRLLHEVATKVRRRAWELVDEVTGTGPFDFAERVAEQLPMGTICDLLRIPEPDRPQLLEWNKQALSSDDTSTDHLTAVAARTELLWYLSDLARSRREIPDDDVVSTIATAKVDGRPLTLDDVALNCYSVILGGDESSRMSAIVLVHALAGNPDQLSLLRDDETVFPTATEEALRWATPAMHFARTAATDVEVHGRQIRAGDVVTLWNTSANDDEDEFDSARRLDLTRRPNRHLALGHGPHFCVGAYLGRVELDALLRVLASRVSGIEVVAPPARVYSNFLFGYHTMSVRFSA
jgi:cytochrome P450